MYIFTDETLRYLISKIKSQVASKKSLDNKVDKVDGKVLSDNDFTNSAKQVLETKYDSVRVESSTGKSNIIISNESLDVKTIELKTSCDMFFYPNIDETIFADLNGNIILPYAFISKSGSAIGNITVNINNLTTGTNTNYVFEVIDGKNNEVELQGVSAGDVKLTFTIEGNTEELKANVLKEYSTVIMLPLTVYRSTNPSLIPSNVSNVKTVVSDFGNGEYEIMLYTATSTNYLNFSNVQTLTNVSYISDSIISMDSTYYNCRNLKGSPVCGNKVVTMFCAYDSCTNLTGSPVCGDNVTSMLSTYNGCKNLTGSPVCGNNVTSMYRTYQNCYNLTGSPACGDNVTSMHSTYYNCYNLTGNAACGDNVTDMGAVYYYCNNLTGSPACGNNVTNMAYAYYYCYNLTGSPACGPNVTDMSYAYVHCHSITGSPICENNVTNMAYAYFCCYNLTGNPACGPNVTSMANAYESCSGLSGSPACGNNVTDMAGAYYSCYNITGNPVCGPNVTTMHYTYYNCINLTGSPVCGPNVVSMSSTYRKCNNLTGNPVCGDNVTSMGYTYENCTKLTGSPVCGPNVTSMVNTYSYCYNLTGNPVCGDKVTNMYSTYMDCSNLTGLPICGNNVTNMYGTYHNCKNLGPNGYFCSKKISNVSSCFGSKNNSRMLNLYVPQKSTTLNTCINSVYSIVGIADMRWTNDIATNGCYYNAAYNFYIYPVDNVAQKYKDNELKIMTYNTVSYSGNPLLPNQIDGANHGYTYEVIKGTNENQITLYKNDPSDIITRIKCSNMDGIFSVSYVTNEITNMYQMYHWSTLIKTTPMCGPNVTNMAYAYYESTSLEDNPICGPNVTNMYSTYDGCKRLKSNGYFYSNKIINAGRCFANRNTSNRLNLYVPITGYNSTHNTLTSCLRTNSTSLTGNTITWTNDMTNNGCYYNTFENIYVYPVSNVAAVKEKNEKLVTEYTTISESYAPTFNSGFAYTISNTYNSTTQNYTYTVLANTKGSLPSYISFESVKDTQGRDVDQILSAQASEASVSPLVVFSSYGTVSNVKHINLSKTTNLYKIFNDQSLLNTIDISTCNINNITNMSEAFYFCDALVASPVCGTKVTDMSNAYRYCFNLTGSPVCGPNVTNMSWAYRDCRKLTGSPVCGPNVTNMSNAYVVCHNLTGNPVVGNKVTDMSGAYRSCSKLTGSPVFGPNVTNIVDAYEECVNLKGNPICPNTVTSMSGLYYNCSNLTGSPVCGTNITNMRFAYYNCRSLTGSPACGNKVDDMNWAYRNCRSLTGSPVCGPNVTTMYGTYYDCYNLYGDFYVYSNKVSNATNCFYGRNSSNRLNIYTTSNSKTFNTFMTSNAQSLVGSSITWSNAYKDIMVKGVNEYNALQSKTIYGLTMISGNTYYIKYGNPEKICQLTDEGNNHFSYYSNVESVSTRAVRPQPDGFEFEYNSSTNSTTFTITKINDTNDISAPAYVVGVGGIDHYYNSTYNIHIYPIDNIEEASKTIIRKSLTATETIDEWNLETDIDWDTEYLEIETDNNRWYGEKLTANMNIYSGIFSLGEGNGLGSPNTITFNNILNELFISDSDMNFHGLDMPNFDMSKAYHYIFKIDRTGITAKAFTDTGESTGFLAINTDSFSTYLSEIFALNHIKISGVGNYNSDIEIRVIKY